MLNKKIVLSTLTALAITTLSANANDVKLYSDADGQVFATAGEGRVELKSKKTPVHAKASKLKFSGLTYIGLTHNDYKTDSSTVDFKDDKTNFEIRRAYFQLKAYLLDDPKSYYRITFDMHQNGEDDMVIRAKYAYLYLNNILPFTGVEVGLVHRPWHDYEEHNAWYYRNISKVLIEAKNGGDLSNSADFGFNFKSKTQYFDGEAGLFNGEGYHSDFNDDEGGDAGVGMSLEYRATLHILGVNGKDKQTKKTYFDASIFGQYNQQHKASASGIAGEYDDLVFNGLHTVYNQPNFLLSAQYIISNDTADNSTYVSKQAGSGYSVNGECRFGHDYDYRAIARYDSWIDKKVSSSDEKVDNAYIIGGVWEQNSNVQWVANVTVTDNETGSSREKYNGIAYMLTAEVKF